MKILLVGKTGVFDTLAVASGYLDKMDLYASPYFADLTLENSKQLVNMGADKRGDELYIVGYNAPDIILIINQELKSLSKINKKELQVIPISVQGENTTWLLSKLANAPLIGPLFLKWVKNRTVRRSSYLFEFGKNLRLTNNLDEKNMDDFIFAAKPLVKDDKK